MHKIGIIGKNHCESYISAINLSKNIKLIGVFDPSFQFEHPKNIQKDLIYLSFEELLINSDSIIFASSEKIYLPLIEVAIKYSRSVFLHSIHNLSYQEQIQLFKLQEEAGIILQIQQPIIFNEVFKKYVDLSNKPLLINYGYSDSSETQLLYKTRLIISAILSLYKSNLRKITINIISTFSEIPDIIKIRMDFDNGSVSEIMADSIGNQKAHFIKCYEYNSCLEVNLIENTLIGKNETHDISIHTTSNNNTNQNIINKQLIDFHTNILNHSMPINSIENEMSTQEVIEKVKEKLRISINIC